jgi:GNAT superfamily N-acetyltransferase
MGDLPFIDGLQKANTYRVGFLPGAQLEDHVAKEAVLIAQEGASGEGQGASEDGWPFSARPSPLAPRPSLGYVIAKDRYLRRDDLGVIYQLNVTPARQRHLIGASLIKAAFDRAAYGCRLFCCWCAQDLEANYFWEALGFVPLAFRTGCRKRQRIHIFWQRRVRENDCQTPYWFPSQTHSGAYREDRLVLPIPSEVHWRDVMPRVLPGMEPKQITEKKRGRGTHATKKTKLPPKAIVKGGFRFSVQKETAHEAKPKRELRPKVKNDPKLIAAARELRDRWLEHVNTDPGAPGLLSHGKYEVSRALPQQQQKQTARLLLEAA